MLKSSSMNHEQDIDYFRSSDWNFRDIPRYFEEEKGKSMISIAGNK